MGQLCPEDRPNAGHMGQESTGERTGRWGIKGRVGSGKGVQGMGTQWGPLLRVAGGGAHMERWECWTGKHRIEGIARMRTYKPTDTPSPLQVRSPTTAPGKAVAGNLPALMS